MILVAFWNAMVNAIRVLFFGLLAVFVLVSVMFFAFILWKAAKSPESPNEERDRIVLAVFIAIAAIVALWDEMKGD